MQHYTKRETDLRSHVSHFNDFSPFYITLYKQYISLSHRIQRKAAIRAMSMSRQAFYECSHKRGREESKTPPVEYIFSRASAKEKAVQPNFFAPKQRERERESARSLKSLYTHTQRAGNSAAITT